MKRFKMLFGLGVSLIISSVALGAVPQLINFQGILKDGSGNPVANGSYSVVFTIYDDPAAGNILWAETTSVSTTSGLFSVLLGSTNPVPDSAFKDTSRYLGIKVGADPEMTPRQRLSSVGYSYNSSEWTSAGENLFRLNGKVAIGTNNPLGLLHLKGGNHKLLLESSGNADVVIGRADATRYGNFILADGNPSIGANNRWAIGLRNGDSKLHLYDEQNSSNVMVLEQGGKVGIGTTTPNSRLQVNGALATAITAITVNSTLNETHSVVLASTPGVSDVVITLPTAVGIAGRQYTIKKADAAAHTVVIDANGVETIDGTSVYNLTTQNKYVTIVSNGANWFVIANN